MVGEQIIQEYELQHLGNGLVDNEPRVEAQ